MGLTSQTNITNCFNWLNRINTTIIFNLGLVYTDTLGLVYTLKTAYFGLILSV